MQSTRVDCQFNLNVTYTNLLKVGILPQFVGGNALRSAFEEDRFARFHVFLVERAGIEKPFHDIDGPLGRAMCPERLQMSRWMTTATGTGTGTVVGDKLHTATDCDENKRCLRRHPTFDRFAGFVGFAYNNLQHLAAA